MKRTRLVAILLVALVALAGCSGSSVTSPEPQSTSPAPTATETSTTSTPSPPATRTGGELLSDHREGLSAFGSYAARRVVNASAESGLPPTAETGAVSTGFVNLTTGERYARIATVLPSLSGRTVRHLYQPPAAERSGTYHVACPLSTDDCRRRNTSFPRWFSTAPGPLERVENATLRRTETVTRDGSIRHRYTLAGDGDVAAGANTTVRNLTVVVDADTGVITSLNATVVRTDGQRTVSRTTRITVEPLETATPPTPPRAVTDA